MSEWPKQFYPDDEVTWTSRTERYEVIPADLGRELYEALKEVMPETGSWELTADNVKLVADALARYEREVGER